MDSLCDFDSIAGVYSSDGDAELQVTSKILVHVPLPPYLSA